MKTRSRGLSPAFMDALQTGLLAPIRARVLADRSLCLEIRDDYVNIYYRGGNLMKIAAAKSGYEASFDRKYFADSTATLPAGLLGNSADVDAWLRTLPILKDAMDLWFGRHPKEEREVQQLILRDNNRSNVARSTDYYLCDIEYANREGRFDFVGVHWPSTSMARKRAGDRRLVLGEVKFGDGALAGNSGLVGHVAAINQFLGAPGARAALEAEMVTVFNQKRALGLIDCGKDLADFGDAQPMLLLVLVNHDPEKSTLLEQLKMLPSSPHAEIRIARASFMGYGLYDTDLLTLRDAIAALQAHA